jgi:uncharacterized protein
MLYLDTSVLIGAMTPEAKTLRIQSWMTAHVSDVFNISHWTITEFSSALSLKTRTGQINAVQRADAIGTFNRLRAESFVVRVVRPSHFVTAAGFADIYSLGLRAADALHLAISMDIGATLCTLDKKLAAAASALGASISMLTETR